MISNGFVYFPHLIKKLKNSPCADERALLQILIKRREAEAPWIQQSWRNIS